MKCLHHSDMDGNCSGAIVYWFHKKRNEHVECFPVNYNEDIPFEKIEKNEKVYVVDFSFVPEDYKKLLSITDDVIWIDHHVSAIDKFKNTPIENLPGIRRNGEAGCELTWKYFYGDSKNTKIPTIVKMLGRYDVWDFSIMDKESLSALQQYCRTVDTEPYSKVWEHWLDIEYSPKKEMEIGKQYLKYRDFVWKKFLKSWGFEVELDGYKALACNTASVNSDFFITGENKDYDLFIPFIFDGENWVVSLYTIKNNVDCSKLAVKYGGGGHKKAAGFVTKKLPFIEV